MLLCFLFFFRGLITFNKLTIFSSRIIINVQFIEVQPFLIKHTLAKIIIKKTRLTFNDNADSTIPKKIHNRCEDARKIDIQTKYWKKHRCWKLNEIFNHNFTSIPSRSIIFTFAFTHIHTKVVTSPFVTLFHDKKDV